MAKSKTATEAIDMPIESKLKFLYELQLVDSKIDEIIHLRGELPLEVQDLEDEIVGLETRIKNYQSEAREMESMVLKKKNDIETSKALIKKYNDQQKNVRNNREFDSLSKEIEYQTLEIELSEKKIKEFSFQAKEKKRLVEETSGALSDRKMALEAKQKELKEITDETQREEDDLRKASEAYKDRIEERLYNAYQRIRKNARNGLAVVSVSRDACGGCFNRIPPQRQVDIKLSKKIIVCEYCGRILIDAEALAGEAVIKPKQDTPTDTKADTKTKTKAKAKAK
ncbi:MAG: C4-type zinc ribbon domain-containing protein [Prevotellaceae bacterium]|jgi:predicted  nucleic acid-binding Zn-ribbon protein|nr:C4-type zinc ribbon domain-containing protein [Prevotellaceae bacterium]